jgi:predicted porin
MNKKLVTLAVAAAMAAPAAAMADAVLYGKLNVAIDYMDQEHTLSMGQVQSIQEYDADYTNAYNDLREQYGNTLPPERFEQLLLRSIDNIGFPSPLPTGFKGWGLSGNNGTKGYTSNPFIPNPQGPASRIGVKGSEDLGNGLKAIYQVEFGISLTDTNNTAVSGNEAISMRNSYVGLAGNFGTVLAGRHDTPLKISTGPLDLFADTMADYNNTVGFQDLRADNVIAYISPSFSGFQFAGAMHAGGGATAVGTFNEDADSIAEAYSLAAIYKNGPWYAGLAYESLSEELAGYTDDQIDDPNYAGDDWNKVRVGLGILDWNGFSLTGIYENWDGGYFNEDVDSDLWQIQAGYAFNNFMVKAMYGQAEVDGLAAPFGSTEWDTWAVGADYNFSKRTKAFLLYTGNDLDDVSLAYGIYDENDNITGIGVDSYDLDWQGFQLGVMHTF